MSRRPAPRFRYADIAAALPAHLAEFLGIPEAEVARRTAASREERNRRWIEAAPRSEADRNRLYASLGDLDLLKYAEWHRTDVEKHAIHDEALRTALAGSTPVLDCGGGIGDTTLLFAANGIPATYVDFPGVCSDFARFRWRNFGCAHLVTPLTPQDFWSSATARFALILSIDVLEHLENPVRHADRYRRLLAPRGHLFVTAHFRHSERNPDHLPENDAFHRLFGGERGTSRRSILRNLGFRSRRWYHWQV